MTPRAAYVEGGLIAVSTTYDEREVARSVPGGAWNPDLKRWEWPAEPEVARNLRDAFGGRNFTDDVLELARGAEQDRARRERYRNAEDLEQPEVRKTDAWRHQLRAYHFARDLKAAALFMEMGTGKSKVIIDLIQNRGHDLTVVVCPKSVVGVWPREVEKHSAIDLEVVAPRVDSVAKRVAELERKVELARARGRPVVAVVNYAAVLSDPLKNWLDNEKRIARGVRPIEFGVLDESHRIKAPGGKQSRTLYRLGRRWPWRALLTGTPLPHSPLDAYAQYRFLDSKVFGTSFVKFRSRYAVMGGYQNHQVVGYQNHDEFRDRLYSVAYRVTADVLDLPPSKTVERIAELSAEETRRYRELEALFITELDEGAVTVGNALVKLLRLQQATSGFLKTDDGDLVDLGTTKASLFGDVLDELDSEEPIVVFCRFHRDLDHAKRVASAAGREVAELSGRVNDLEAWLKGEASVLVAQLQSGKEGIDLTRARYAVYYSVGFSLGDYQQSLKRLDRPGQERPVTNVHLVCRLSDGTPTVDRRVVDALERRAQVVEAVLESYDRSKFIDDATNDAVRFALETTKVDPERREE